MNLIEKIIFNIKHLYNKEFHHCPICGTTHRFKEFGNPIRREHVRCKYCNSLERHRFVYYLYKDFLKTKTPIDILHTAPEKCFADIIAKNKNIKYIPVDLNPENYSFTNCKKEDATNLSFDNNTFDYILSNHVMEHIKEEEKFLSEFLRVLKPGGRIYLTIPIDFKRDKSFEVDNAETPEERFKYYEQKDHVRIYGKDIIAKLKDKYNAEFLDVEALKIQDINKQRICSDDSVFIITKS